MLRYYGPEYHSLLSDSETESDDNIYKGPKKRDVNGPSNNKEEGSGASNKRKEKGKAKLLPDNKANEDQDGADNKRGESGDKGKGVLLDNAVRVPIIFKSQANEDREHLEELAKRYQKKIKIISIPTAPIANVTFSTWEELAKTLRTFYGQPIHYLTYKLCKQWDESMIGSEDERKTLVAILQCSNAESTLWNVEKVHRLTTSPNHLAKLWLEDPKFNDVVAEVIPSP